MKILEDKRLEFNTLFTEFFSLIRRKCFHIFTAPSNYLKRVTILCRTISQETK